MWLCMRRARYLRGRMELMGNKVRTYRHEDGGTFLRIIGFMGI